MHSRHVRTARGRDYRCIQPRGVFYGGLAGERGGGLFAGREEGTRFRRRRWRWLFLRFSPRLVLGSCDLLVLCDDFAQHFQKGAIEKGADVGSGDDEKSVSTVVPHAIVSENVCEERHRKTVLLLTQRRNVRLYREFHFQKFVRAGIHHRLRSQEEQGNSAAQISAAAQTFFKKTNLEKKIQTW